MKKNRRVDEELQLYVKYNLLNVLKFLVIFELVEDREHDNAYGELVEVSNL